MNKEKCPDILLERYFLRELPEKQMRQIDKHLAEHPEEQKRLENLKKSNDEILNQDNFKYIKSKIMNASNAVVPEKQKNILNFFISIKTLAPIAALVLFFIIYIPMSKPEKSHIRLKGIQPHIMIYRKHGGKAKQLHDGSVARKNDLLQISYIAAGNKYGTIFSIDSRGVFTIHYPDKKDTSRQLQQKKEILLDKSYELDDAPDFEIFFFISSKQSFNMKDMIQKVKNNIDIDKLSKNKRLSLSDEFVQSSILIRKGE